MPKSILVCTFVYTMYTGLPCQCFQSFGFYPNSTDFDGLIFRRFSSHDTNIQRNRPKNPKTRKIGIKCGFFTVELRIFPERSWQHCLVHSSCRFVRYFNTYPLTEAPYPHCLAMDVPRFSGMLRHDPIFGELLDLT